MLCVNSNYLRQAVLKFSLETKDYAVISIIALILIAIASILIGVLIVSKVGCLVNLHVGSGLSFIASGCCSMICSMFFLVMYKQNKKKHEVIEDRSDIASDQVDGFKESDVSERSSLSSYSSRGSVGSSVFEDEDLCWDDEIEGDQTLINEIDRVNAYISLGFDVDSNPSQEELHKAFVDRKMELTIAFAILTKSLFYSNNQANVSE